MWLVVVPRDSKGPKEINLEGGKDGGRKGRHFNAAERGNLTVTCLMAFVTFPGAPGLERFVIKKNGPQDKRIC